MAQLGGLGVRPGDEERPAPLEVYSVGLQQSEGGVAVLGRGRLAPEHQGGDLLEPHGLPGVQRLPGEPQERLLPPAGRRDPRLGLALARGPGLQGGQALGATGQQDQYLLAEEKREWDEELKRKKADARAGGDSDADDEFICRARRSTLPW